ncbi:MAG: IclR family transcriptional regulator [Burkholderiaceae bacterium]|jgi:IclR family acetate operon transcriptional repressor
MTSALRSSTRPSAHELPDLESSSKETPILRLLALLEIIARKDAPFSLQNLVQDTQWPKPSLHRMLAQLEASGLLQRDLKGRHYSTGQRLTQLAENVLLNSTTRAARHRVLRLLVDQAGESCNLTSFSAGEVLYLDRVETAAPLRFYLHSGSRVPAHCSATGKLFLSQMSPSQRQKLWDAGPLERFTERTLVDVHQLEEEITKVRVQGFAIDDEEFLPGLLCIGVLVPSLDSKDNKTNMGIALQAPKVRFSLERAMQCLPLLQNAAQALSRINQSASNDEDDLL